MLKFLLYRDARQMNLSVKSFNAKSFNADPSKQESRFDDSNEKNLVTGVEHMDLDLQQDLITGEK